MKRCQGCRKCSNKNQKRPYEAVFNTARDRILGRYDRAKAREFTLTFEDFLSIVETGKCHYCHVPVTWAKHAIHKTDSGHHMDRKDNEIGYTVENLVACCVRCNFSKGDRYSYEEWMAMTECYRNGTIAPGNKPFGHLKLRQRQESFAFRNPAD